MCLRCGEPQPSHAGGGVPCSGLVRDVAPRIAGVIDDGAKCQGKQTDEEEMRTVEPEHGSIEFTEAEENMVMMEPDYEKKHECRQISANGR